MSKFVVVRYATHPEAADENQQLVEHVYAELTKSDPGGLRYATFRLADGVTFVHLAILDSETTPNPLQQSAAFAEFQRGIGGRCHVPPEVNDARLVGSYGFAADLASL